MPSKLALQKRHCSARQLLMDCFYRLDSGLMCVVFPMLLLYHLDTTIECSMRLPSCIILFAPNTEVSYDSSYGSSAAVATKDMDATTCSIAQEARAGSSTAADISPLVAVSPGWPGCCGRWSGRHVLQTQSFRAECATSHSPQVVSDRTIHPRLTPLAGTEAAHLCQVGCNSCCPASPTINAQSSNWWQSTQYEPVTSFQWRSTYDASRCKLTRWWTGLTPTRVWQWHFHAYAESCEQGGSPWRASLSEDALNKQIICLNRFQFLK